MTQIQAHSLVNPCVLTDIALMEIEFLLMRQVKTENIINQELFFCTRSPSFYDLCQQYHFV